MARKKTKRPNLPQETLERARAELRGDVSVSDLPAPPDMAAVSMQAAPRVAAPVKPKRGGTGLNAPRRVPNVEELIAEYRYVLHDLRNLVVLAGVLLVAIVIASFVLARPIG